MSFQDDRFLEGKRLPAHETILNSPSDPAAYAEGNTDKPAQQAVKIVYFVLTTAVQLEEAYLI